MSTESHTLDKITGSFSYRLTDVIKANSYFYKTNPYYNYKRIGAIVLVIINIINLFSFLPIFIVSLIAKTATPIRAFDRLVAIGIVIVLVFLILLLISVIGLFQPITKLQIARAYRRKKHNYEERYELLLDKEALSVNLPDWKSALGWTRIDNVYEYPEGFLVIYNRGDYLAIPKRAFDDVPTIEKFKRLVTEYSGVDVLTIK